MIAVCLPQPWAGLVLSGQVKAINARRYTSRREELLIYARGTVAVTHDYSHVKGLMDLTEAYLGFVTIANATDPYELDLEPYLGLGWWWQVDQGDMLFDPVGAEQDRAWGDSFMVPQEHRDYVNPLRLGWTAWWDRYLDQINARRREAKP